MDLTVLHIVAILKMFTKGTGQMLTSGKWDTVHLLKKNDRNDYFDTKCGRKDYFKAVEETLETLQGRRLCKKCFKGING